MSGNWLYLKCPRQGWWARKRRCASGMFFFFYTTSGLASKSNLYRFKGEFPLLLRFVHLHHVCTYHYVSHMPKVPNIEWNRIITKSNLFFLHLFAFPVEIPPYSRHSNRWAERSLQILKSETISEPRIGEFDWKGLGFLGNLEKKVWQLRLVK